MRPSLIVLVPYFGRWPEWIDLFVETCRWNADIVWRIFTDCGETANRAPNVELVPTGFDDYKALARRRLDVDFDPADPYKLCDLRPALGELHRDEIDGFDFFGFGDLDVVYGRLRQFYTDDLLRRSRVLSTHPERLSGHFAVLRNTAGGRRLYRAVRGYREILADPRYLGLDEALGGELLGTGGGSGALSGWLKRLDPRRRGLVFVERYSTILGERAWHDGTRRFPRRWIWRRGRLTNTLDGDREFMYLHFMRWHSRRWAAADASEEEGPWTRLDRAVQVDWREAAERGFAIGPGGFTQLTPEEAPAG